VKSESTGGDQVRRREDELVATTLTFFGERGSVIYTQEKYKFSSQVCVETMRCDAENDIQTA